MSKNTKAVVIDSPAMAVQQLSSGWGMRMIQGQFPRMKDRFTLEDLGDHVELAFKSMIQLYILGPPYFAFNGYFD